MAWEVRGRIFLLRWDLRRCENILGAVAIHEAGGSRRGVHASAWDIDNKDDLRVKMCIQLPRKISGRFITNGAQLLSARVQHAAALFQNSANDGFHEAVGDTIALSVTPEYLKSDWIDRESPAGFRRY